VKGGIGFSLCVSVCLEQLVGRPALLWPSRFSGAMTLEQLGNLPAQIRRPRKETRTQLHRSPDLCLALNTLEGPGQRAVSERPARLTDYATAAPRNGRVAIARMKFRSVFDRKCRQVTI
jgi:hypothetical protein